MESSQKTTLNVDMSGDNAWEVCGTFQSAAGRRWREQRFVAYWREVGRLVWFMAWNGVNGVEVSRFEVFLSLVLVLIAVPRIVSKKI